MENKRGKNCLFEVLPYDETIATLCCDRSSADRSVAQLALESPKAPFSENTLKAKSVRKNF